MPQVFAVLVPSLLIIWLQSTPAVYAQPDPSASVTIDQLADYSFQRQCGKGCVQNNYDNGADIENVLGCTWNGCYCASSVQATSIIASCWSAYCGSTVSRDSPDVSTAISLYNAYCGATAAEKNVVAVTTTPATPDVVETSVTVTLSGSSSRWTTVYITSTNSVPVTNYPPASSSSSASQPTNTNTGSDANTSSEKKGYSTSDKIALGVGLGVGIPTFLATLYMCLFR